jgi:DNA-binding transcriptional ArsR family regulator
MEDIAFYQGLYHCLSDQTRLRIISLILRYKQVCTIDLEWALDITQAKSSRHLRLMDYTGIVTRQRIENWVFYAIRPEKLALVESLIEPFKDDTLLIKDAEHYRIMLTNRELAASRLYLKSLATVAPGQ